MEADNIGPYGEDLPTRLRDRSSQIFLSPGRNCAANVVNVFDISMPSTFDAL
jgi:hypothetical protein